MSSFTPNNGSVVGDVLNFVPGLAGMVYDIYSNEDSKNYARERDRLADERYLEERDYNRALQQTIFDREDSAFQRAVQDADKAGLNALAVSGGANSGAVVSSAQHGGNAQQPTPTSMFNMLRSLQDLALAEDANERAWFETKAKIDHDKELLDITRDKNTMDFNLASSAAFNQAMRWSWEQHQHEKEFGWKQKMDTREMERAFAKDLFEMESWNKQFYSNEDKFEKEHDLKFTDMIWSNINSSVGVFGDLLDSILPGGMLKQVTKGLGDSIKKQFGKDKIKNGVNYGSHPDAKPKKIY